MSSSEPPGEPSQEELQAYLEQLRAAPAEEIVVQAYSLLGTGAEVKLGRPDARVLIDAIAGLVQGAGPRLGELGTRMTSGLAQLQMAQVDAERKARGATEAAPAPAASEPSSPSAGPTSTDPLAGAPTDAEDQRMTDRLWIPGRDPGPAPR